MSYHFLQFKTIKKAPNIIEQCWVLFSSGDVLLSQEASLQVPSAQKGLTSVFGMGTGVTLSPSSPENFWAILQVVPGYWSLVERLSSDSDPI